MYGNVLFVCDILRAFADLQQQGVVILSSQKRIKIYDILHHDNLSLIRLSLVENNCLKNLFDQLERKEIKIKFFASHQERDDVLQLAFCVERSALKTAQNILYQLSLKDEDIHVNAEAGMVAIYGPHFVEQYGIIDNMHNTLSSQGVSVLAISTTISSSFFVIPASEVVRAVDILNEAFEIPKGKV